MRRTILSILLCTSSFYLVHAFHFASRTARCHPLSNRFSRVSQHSTSLYMFEEPNLFDENKDIEESRLTDEELLAQTPEWDETVARFNTVHLCGRIGGEPAARYLDNGQVVVNLSLAVQRKYHGLERKHLNIAYGQEETDWFGLEIWGQKAEFVSKYVDRGMRVCVIGTLQIDQWTDKESGEPRNRAKVVVREFELMETRAETEMRRSKRGGGGGASNFYSGDDFGAAGSGGFFDD